MGRPLTLGDLYAFKRVGEPSLSPDGARVAYTVTTADAESDGYRSQVWVASAADQPQRFTGGTRDSAPQWSPDGRWLAFVRSGDGVPQLWVLPTHGGDARVVDDGPVAAYDWAPDSRRLAVIQVVDLRGASADEAEQQRRQTAPVEIERFGYKADGTGLVGSRRTHLFIVPVDGGDTTQLTDGDFSVMSPAWSPDGSSIAVLTAVHDDRDLDAVSHVAVVPSAGGEVRILTDWEGIAEWVGWFPDRGRLLVAGLERVDTALHNALFTLPSQGGKPERLLPEFDRNIMTGGPGYPGAPPQIDSDGVVFCARDRGTVHLYVADLGGGQVRKLIDEEERLVSGCSRAGDRLAYVVADPSSLSEVALRTVGADDEQQVTHHNTFLEEVHLHRAASRTFAGPDGSEVHGRVLAADGATGPRPVLLDIHGGPHNAWGPALDDVHLYHQALAEAGWVVLMLNTVGSDGYGQDWYAGLRGGWGRNDERQFHTALDTLVDEGIADPARIAVTGYSYGGYMTNWLLSASDRFAAAVTGGSVTSLSSFYGTSDAGPLLLCCELGADLFDEPARYADLSPLTRADTIDTPTLILHGELDHRCPVGQAEELFASLRRRRIPTRLVRYPDAGHLFIIDGRPSHRRHYNEQVVDWLRRHVE